MADAGPCWSTQQLTELLATVSEVTDPASLQRRVVEHASEALDAEVAAVVEHDQVVASVGFPRGQAPSELLLAAAEGHLQVLQVEGGGACEVLVADCDGVPGLRLLVARSDGGYSQEERSLLRGTARVLSMALVSSRTVDDLRERQTLLERLSRIQGSISSRAPLHEVLDTITAGAAELIGDDIVGLRLVDPAEPETLLLVSSVGVPAHLTAESSRTPLGWGVGGRAALLDMLVVTDAYTALAAPIPGFAEDGIRSAMAVPVRQGGRPVGSLTVATRRAGRVYSASEQEVLTAFAEHVSLALNDAQTVEALQRAVQEATHQSLHDGLTGLPNRALFLDRLARAREHSDRHGTPLAVLFLDLDDFKVVNDSLGHLVGDQLLSAVADRVVTALRGCDTVARLGGDEFAVLLGEADHNEATVAADRVLMALEEPFDLGTHTVHVGASIGLVTAVGAQVLAEELLRDADVAMYRAKADGKRRYVVFEAGMRHRLQARTELESELRVAVEQHQFTVHYQPVVDAASGRVTSTEALVRWNHPRRGTVSPAEFIPLAEDTGIIVALGSQVLREACRQTAQWRLLPALHDLTVSVNLSPRQLAEPQLLADVEAALTGSGLPARALVLEVTESLFVQDLTSAAARLHSLKALGVRLAVDDFGTGYSSLAYLSRLPVDVLKVDRSFVAGMAETGSAEGKLASVVLALAASLELDTVAEGVETRHQAEALVAQGCTRLQGYHFSRPVAPDLLPQVAADLCARLSLRVPAIPIARSDGDVSAVSAR
ncbi:MAG: EAL domain-containing protein [Mycobacteriales bacterium]|nr:EAL domain-containing protein [Mycobacteriales bacterium]